MMGTHGPLGSADTFLSLRFECVRDDIEALPSPRYREIADTASPLLVCRERLKMRASVLTVCCEPTG